MFKILETVFGLLFPPISGESREVMMWRLSISGICYGLLVTFLLHIAWACNLWPFTNGGFAEAAEVNRIYKVQLEEKLQKLYTALCENPGDEAILELIRNIQREYREVNDGQNYTPPSCELLMRVR